MASNQVNNGKQSATRSGVDRSVTDGSPMPMAELETGTHIIRYVNPAFCLLAGKTKEKLIGSDFTDLTAAGEDFLSLFQRVHQTGKAEPIPGARIRLRLPTLCTGRMRCGQYLRQTIAPLESPSR